MFSAMRYERGRLFLLDQRILPHEKIWLDFGDCESIAKAIEDMVVRGAPAIGCAAAFALAIDALNQPKAQIWENYQARFESCCECLARTRPTAVNLFKAIDVMRQKAKNFSGSDLCEKFAKCLETSAVDFFNADIETCKQIGEHGLVIASRQKKINVLTHCNTGSLATAGYGTALGVIRSLSKSDQLGNVYVDETRPFLQGSRLTAFELFEEGIPFKLITDSTAAYLMQCGEVDCVVIGADRIAANGDTANKIGSYSLAVLCQYHQIPFYVAAPLTTFDFNIASGEFIPVEQRASEEITHWGTRPIAPDQTKVYNPSFDITPAELISGIITEVGILRAPFLDSISAVHVVE